jgi:hypothetical protein
MLPIRPSLLLSCLLAILLSGCAAMATQGMADNLSHAMLNQDDPATVRTGAPAYLLLIDSLIEENPEDRELLIAGARLYGAYAGGLVENGERAKRLTRKSRDYARRAMCGARQQMCELEKLPFDEFVAYVAQIGPSELKTLYAYGISWAGWIQARSDDWSALADLPKVEAVLERVVALDPGYDRGRAHLYLGVMRTQLPPALGGKPERGRTHFDQALKFSGGRDLMAKVEYARRYARLVFNQELHDRLLKEVLAADPREPDLTLSNVLAQEQARELLQDEYF